MKTVIFKFDDFIREIHFTCISLDSGLSKILNRCVISTPPTFGGAEGDGDNKNQAENANKENEDGDILSFCPCLLTKLPVLVALLVPGIHVQSQVPGDPPPLVQGAGGLAPGQTHLHRIATHLRVVEHLDTKNTTFCILHLVTSILSFNLG